MGNVTFGSIFKKSATYAVGLLAARSLSFVLIPLYTRYLTTADYGILELLDLTLSLTLVFAGSRLGQALFYYYFAETDEDVRARHMSTNMLASVLFGAIALAVCWFFSPQLSWLVFGTAEYARYFRMTSVAVGVAIPMENGLCCVRAFNQPSVYSLISIVRTMAAALINVILLSKFHMGVASVLWSLIVTQSIVAVYLMVYVYRRVPFSFDMRLFRLQAKYSAPMSVGSLGEFVLNYGDRYFLRQVVSLSDIGIYSLAYKIGMLIPTIQGPFALYWLAQEVKVVRAEGGWKIFTRVATYQLLGLTAVTILIALFIEPLLKLLVTPAFRTAGKYGPWIALAYLVRAMSGPPREVFVIEKRPEKEAYVVWIGTILCLLGYAFLIPRFGLWGAVAATCGSFVCVFLISYLISQRLRRVEYEYRRAAIIAGAAALVIGVFTLVRPASFWTQVGTGCLMLILWFLLLHLAGLWQQNEKAFMRDKLSRVFWAKERAQ
jgi:O-antigen/teichoic acid export membrane protein